MVKGLMNYVLVHHVIRLNTTLDRDVRIQHQKMQNHLPSPPALLTSVASFALTTKSIGALTTSGWLVVGNHRFMSVDIVRIDGGAGFDDHPDVLVLKPPAMHRAAAVTDILRSCFIQALL